MGTTVKSLGSAGAQISQIEKLSLARRYEAWVDSLKFYHFFIMAFAVLVGSCLGSISALFIFYAGAPIWVFAIGLFATLANLVAAISQAPTKWMVTTFLLSVLVNLVLVALFPMI